MSNRRDGRRLGPVDGDRPERDPEISRGATATVKNNSVSGNVYQPATVVSVGVLLFTSGAVAVENNDLDQNDVGVYATPTGAGTTVKNNNVSNTTYDGIAIQDSDQVAVSSNKVTGGEPGIGVYGTTNSVFENNQVTNSRSQGIFADSASSGTTRPPGRPPESTAVRSTARTTRPAAVPRARPTSG